MGTRTTITNFDEICACINRRGDKVYPFIAAELNCHASYSDHKLTIKGRFQRMQLEGVFRRYIGEYVKCKSCQSLDTILTKDSTTKLTMLMCNFCKSCMSISKR